MQLKNLIQPLDKMSDEELQERIREIRHNRTTIRPAAKARESKTAKKGNVTRISKAESILATMTLEERKMMIEQLSQMSLPIGE